MEGAGSRDTPWLHFPIWMPFKSQKAEHILKRGSWPKCNVWWIIPKVCCGSKWYQVHLLKSDYLYIQGRVRKISVLKGERWLVWGRELSAMRRRARIWDAGQSYVLQAIWFLASLPAEGRRGSLRTQSVSVPMGTPVSWGSSIEGSPLRLHLRKKATSLLSVATAG